MAKLDFSTATPAQIEEMKALVKSGDIDLVAKRNFFALDQNRNTTLSDNDLLIIAALEDDDYGHAWWVEQMLALEAEKAAQPKADTCAA